MQEISIELSEWAYKLTLNDIPETVRHEAQRCLLDVVGVGLAGSTWQAPTLLRQHALSTYAAGNCTLFGHDTGMTAAAAAFANAAACHVLDFDDTCYDGIAHGSAAVFPAVLAAAETVGSSGKDFLEAFIVGVESVYRIGRALEDILYHKGWWTTGLLGSIGAAVGAAKLLCSSSHQIDNAIRAAASLTTGNKVVFGSTSKVIGVGRTAQLGLECAQLAAQGISPPVAPVSGNLGIVNMYNEGNWNRELFSPVQESWYSLEKTGIAFKMYPCCSAAQSAIDAVRQLMTEHDLKSSDIQSIQCEVTPFVASCLSYDKPTSITQCQFSITFLTACALKFGTVTPEHLSLECLADEEIVRLINVSKKEITTEMQQLEREDKVYLEANRVTLTTLDGKQHTQLNKIANGMPQLPVSDTQLIEKFISCSKPYLDSTEAEKLAVRLLNIDNKPGKVTELFQIM